jgi:hypothetical protein
MTATDMILAAATIGYLEQVFPGLDVTHMDESVLEIARQNVAGKLAKRPVKGKDAYETGKRLAGEEFGKGII